MNFFKTVFSDEPNSPPSHNSDSDQPDPDHHDTPTETTAWSFGGLIQTLTSKSESVLENYRRDLEEFSSGLKIETSVIREAASRAVKDLPASLDVGASVAQESLETVGQAIDDIGSTVWKSTAQIISHGRDSLLAPDSDSDSYDSNNIKRDLSSSSSSVGDLKRYSRFDVLVRALQSDVNTYLDEPEDLVNFNEWKLGFVLDDKVDEIENLIKENDVVDEIYVKVVPGKIDDEKFWSRYFYKLHKLKQAEDARAKFVKRAISGDEEEDLSWDFDEDDDDGYEPKGITSGVSKETEDNSAEVATTTGDANVEIVKNMKIENDEKAAAESIVDGGDDKLEEENYVDNVVSSVSATVSDQDDKLDVKNVTSEVKTDNDNSGESCKDSDISIVSSQPSMPEEEDISWDEIEDVETNDEKRGDAGASESKIDLRKRLSAATADEDEDLSWDIEDDDEAGKS